MHGAPIWLIPDTADLPFYPKLVSGRDFFFIFYIWFLNLLWYFWNIDEKSCCWQKVDVFLFGAWFFKICCCLFLGNVWKFKWWEFLHRGCVDTSLSDSRRKETSQLEKWIEPESLPLTSHAGLNFFSSSWNSKYSHVIKI